MGGKGGGGGGQATSWDVKNPDMQASWKPVFEENRKNYATEADWYSNYGGAKNPADTRMPGGYTDPWMQSVFTEMYGSAPPAAPAAETAAPAAAAEPEKAAEPEVTPATPAPATPEPATPAPAGDTGLTLGGSVLDPPDYWVGGSSGFKAGGKKSVF